MNEKEYENKLKNYIAQNKIECEHFTFEQSCHSVEEAAKVSNSKPEDLIKTLCLLDHDNLFIVAIVSGTDRVDLKKVASALRIDKKPKIASPDQALKCAGYPVGGTPPFGFSARFLIDENVMTRKFLICGGGSAKSLIKLSPVEMQNANNGEIVDIREKNRI